MASEPQSGVFRGLWRPRPPFLLDTKGGTSSPFRFAPNRAGVGAWPVRCFWRAAVAAQSAARLSNKQRFRPRLLQLVRLSGGVGPHTDKHAKGCASEREVVRERAMCVPVRLSASASASAFAFASVCVVVGSCFVSRHSLGLPFALQQNGARGGRRGRDWRCDNPSGQITIVTVASAAYAPPSVHVD